ncbi:hypothetical protein CRYUN_Cryun02cG0026400 [Craigia yunnanensis]
MGFDRKEYDNMCFLRRSVWVGCFIDGMWKASGSEVSPVNPSNNQAIAKVTEASIGDYEEGMCACNEAAKTWTNVSSSSFSSIHFYCLCWMPTFTYFAIVYSSCRLQHQKEVRLFDR